MTPPEAGDPPPDPEDDGPDPDPPEPGPPAEPADQVPDTLPEDWTDAPDEAPAAPGAGTEEEQDIDALVDHITELESRLQDAERRADELVAVARRQAQMADELHAENQRLRDGEVAQAVAPLVRSAARIADEVAGIRDARPDDPDLEHIGKRLSELLHDAGVTSVSPSPGDPFDARTHQAAGAAPTQVRAEDRCVAEVRRPGLVRDDGRMLRPAEVVVFRFTPPTEEGAAP